MELDSLIQKIREKTNMKMEDVQKKILEKQRELSDLVSREGAAYIVAKELGLDLFERVRKKINIKEIAPGLKFLDFKGRIVRIFETREFVRNGKTSKVANIIIGDETGSLRMSLWDNQTEILRGLEKGQAVEVYGAYSKAGRDGVEVRLSKRGGIRPYEGKDVPEIKLELKSLRADIANFQENADYETRAAIVQLFDSNPFYEVCPNCGTRIKADAGKFKCPTHGFVEPTYSVVLTGVIDDGTANIRAVFFRDNALKIIGKGMEEVLKMRTGLIENLDILGKEFVFRGRVRKNKMFGRLEFVVNNVENSDSKKEAEQLINTFEPKIK